jgi:hypothetical protein
MYMQILDYIPSEVLQITVTDSHISPRNSANFTDVELQYQFRVILQASEVLLKIT